MTNAPTASMTLAELAEVLRADAARYGDADGWRTHPGFWVGASHRLKNWAGTRESRFVRLGVGCPARVLSFFFRHVFNVRIVDAAELGRGLYLVHPRNIIIGPVKIGPNCMIFHEVTLGTNANGPGYPTIGENVSLYVGCRVLGDVTVGDGARVGANCVVTSSVPAGAAVVPANNRLIPAPIVGAFGAPTNPIEIRSIELRRELERLIAEGMTEVAPRATEPPASHANAPEVVRVVESVPPPEPASEPSRAGANAEPEGGAARHASSTRR